MRRRRNGYIANKDNKMMEEPQRQTLPSGATITAQSQDNDQTVMSRLIACDLHSLELPQIKLSNSVTRHQMTTQHLKNRHQRTSLIKTHQHNHCQSISQTLLPKCCQLNWVRHFLSIIATIIVASMLTLAATTSSALLATGTGQPESGLRYDPDTSAYSGLTFSFDPRLDQQQVERLHFDHWLSIMHQASSLLYESLNGRAHFAEVRVLIPYKWRNFEWPVLHKPGSPIIVNRRLRFSDSDVVVSQEDPIYKETPFSLQHDECGRPGLNIRMPISFLEEPQVDERLRARQFVREFASHRWGLFKESGFRSDYMYPPFSSLAGVTTATSKWRWSNSTGGDFPLGYQNQSTAVLVEQLDGNSADASSTQPTQLRGYDDQWRECKFETSPANGLPLVNAQNCLPYLATGHRQTGANQQQQQQSFNLMSADPFSYTASASTANSESNAVQLPQQHQPPANLVHWRQLAESARWHFCGENFPAPITIGQNQLANEQQQQTMEQRKQANWFEHNQRTSNKQNKLCHERNAFDVIKSSDDFRRVPFSLPTFNRIPEPQFKFLQEMPPRVILAFEYTSHLYSSRRLDHSVLESAINKFLAFDLIPDSEVATIVFGQHTSRLLEPLQKLDANLNSRFTLFNPAFDPFDEQAQVFTQQELLDELSHLNSATFNQQQPLPRIVKGTCSFARLMNEVSSLLQRLNGQYDDVGADLIVITSGLFVEDASKIEEIVKQSQFRSDQHKLDLIIYPASMLFDTKSRENLSTLDSIESELIVKNRIEKLLLIQKFLNGKIHLVKEHLDSNGEVKMSTTLMQFHQIFEHISRGHSWDQTSSMFMLEQRLIESRANNNLIANGSKLTYQFEFDSTISEELFVGFVDPRPSSLSSNSITHRPGKRFALKNLQLRSPNGQLLFTETHTASSLMLLQNHANHSINTDQQANELQSELTTSESAFFPYRAQLSLAGFHLRRRHLSAAAPFQPSSSTARLHASGTWTLSAVTEEPLLTSALLMAKTNPNGDTITAKCWIQTYSTQDQSTNDPENKSKKQLKTVKVFVKLESGQTVDTSHVGARMEVHDEMGNIVQNARLLDDGLGAPDVTRNDQIYSQYVQRAYRPGFYKVTVEVSKKTGDHQGGKVPAIRAHNGQDNVCCGSFIPKPMDQVQLPIVGHLKRQIYCGTFYVSSDNKLAEQKPPRINNMTVVNVDQDQRRVTLRWIEPQVMDSIGASMSLSESKFSTSNSLQAVKYADEPSPASESQTTRVKRSSMQQTNDYNEESESHQTQNNGARGVIMSTSKQDQQVAPLSSRYEIKLFSDRDIMMRAFDAKHEVGFKFNEWNVEGVLPNASAFGGQKEVTLRIPFGREGIYFIAMKVYNNLGIASEMSNIVQFYLRNNLTLEELESIYGQSTTIDADGNVYDKNGDLLHRGGQLGTGSYSSLLKGTSGLDGLSVLILLSFLAFFMSIVCISLVACLANSAKKSFKKQKEEQSKKRSNGGVSSGSMLAGSGSSMVSAGTSPAASSNASSCGSNDGDALQQKQMIDQHQQHQYSNYNNRSIQQAHEQQQQQAQMIQSQMLAGEDQYQQQQSWPQHTVVNGYTYATVGTATGVKTATGLTSDHYGNQYGSTAPSNDQHVQPMGDLNQNGLGVDDDLQHSPMSPIHAWPADILLNHYDKIKQARERNEPPAVMRHETLDNNQPFGDGLAPVMDHGNSQDHVSKIEQSYLMRQQQQQLSTYMINQQLQQQLSSVLKSKRRKFSATETNISDSSSPALEGVRGEHEIDAQQYPTSNIEHQVAAPPPPQYIYCTQQGANNDPQTNAAMVDGLAIHHTDPSIYSQSTNLQQVVTGPTLNDGGYYANQWPAVGADQSIYGSAVNHQYVNESINNYSNRANSAAVSEV